MAKRSPEALAQVLRPLQEASSVTDFPDLSVDLEDRDGAAVYHVSEDLSVGLTVGFFMSVMDDP